ncbi:Outer membrane protein (porin) [Burkholderia sp. OK233]|nr:Outer membrane protein (porin) [Burkholderia sp. OK233]
MTFAVAVNMPMAHSQSGVQLFGLLDAGVTYASNRGGHDAVMFDSGIGSPTLFGLRGSEDLGGGSRTVFELTSQFDMGNGATIPGPGALFDRTALVGLANDRFGQITFGNQYDFMTYSLTFKGLDSAMQYVGLYGFRQGPFNGLAIPNNPTGAFDFDRLAGAIRVNNSVRYQSISYAGLSFGAMYGLGNQPGAISRSGTVSFGLNYDHGPFGLGAAYVMVEYPSMDEGRDGIRNFGVGARYAFGAVKTNLLYTNTKNTLTGGQVDVFDIGVETPIAGLWSVGGDYQFMKGNNQLDGNKAHELGAMLRYSVSKRTSAYAEAVYQHTLGGTSGGHNAWINGLLGPDGGSDTSNQTLLRVGLQTVF